MYLVYVGSNKCIFLTALLFQSSILSITFSHVYLKG